MPERRPAALDADDWTDRPPVIEEPDLELAPGHQLWEDLGYLAGLDLGQRQDYSAIALLQRFARTVYVGPQGAPVAPESFEIARAQGTTLDELGITAQRVVAFEVKDLYRWPLMTEYPTIATEVVERLHHSALQGREANARRRQRGRPAPVLVVDAGGATGVVDLLKERGLRPPQDHRPGLVPVAITTGMHARWTAGRMHIPKGALVAAVDVALSQRRLWLPPDLPSGDVLRRELQEFRVRRSVVTGYESFAAREGQHDDTVLALAIALWWGNRLRRDPPGEYVTVKASP
jgi:hypothetical protein